MKKYFFAQLVLVIMVIFSACTEKGLGLDEVQQPVRQKVLSNKGILAFSSLEEFKNTLQIVQEFTLDQRLAWEQEMGFTSFGTLANDVCKSIEKMNFNSEDEFYNFVELNSDYLQIVEYSNEKFLQTKERYNPERWLMNKDRMYIIDTLVYRFYDNNMAVVGPVERVTDIIAFEKLDSLKMPKNCIAYQHILAGNEMLKPYYPAAFPNTYNYITRFVHNDDYGVMVTIFALLAYRITGYDNDNIDFAVRHLFDVGFFKHDSLFWQGPWLPTGGEVLVDCYMFSKSLSYNASAGTKWEIVRNVSRFSELTPPHRQSSSGSEDILLFHSSEAPADFPVPWTRVVYYDFSVYWEEHDIYVEELYSSGYED